MHLHIKQYFVRELDVKTYSPTFPHHITGHYYEGDYYGPYEGVTKPIPSVVEGVF